jgi:hypothetical protein
MNWYTSIKNDIKLFWAEYSQRTIAAVSGAVAAVALLDPAILVDAIGPRGVALLAILNSLLVYWRASKAAAGKL